MNKNEILTRVGIMGAGIVLGVAGVKAGEQILHPSDTQERVTQSYEMEVPIVYSQPDGSTIDSGIKSRAVITTSVKK